MSGEAPLLDSPTHFVSFHWPVTEAGRSRPGRSGRTANPATCCDSLLWRRSVNSELCESIHMRPQVEAAGVPAHRPPDGRNRRANYNEWRLRTDLLACTLLTTTYRLGPNADDLFALLSVLCLIRAPA